MVPLRPFGAAVKRNYARRRLREFLRRNRGILPADKDVLIRLHVAPSDWDRFLGEIAKLLERIEKDGNENGSPDRA